MVRTIHIQLSRFMGPTTERARGKSFAWRRCHLPPRHFKGAHVHFRRFAPHHLAAPFVGVNAHGVRLLLGAGGYSPVLRLTADEMSLPYCPCPKKFTFWDTTLLPRRTFWVRVRAGPLADAPRPFSSCSPAAPRRKMRDRLISSQGSPNHQCSPVVLCSCITIFQSGNLTLVSVCRLHHQYRPLKFAPSSSLYAEVAN